jgi:drug/metabolite transporter (DMT)-like permease
VVKAHTASIIACLEPVYGILIAALLLGEMPGARVVAGGTVILAVTVYVTLEGKRTPAGGQEPPPDMGEEP